LSAYANVTSGSVNAAPAHAARHDAGSNLARLKINTTLSLTRRRCDAIGWRRFSPSLRTFAEDPFGRSGTRTKRQSSGSKANASEDALIWHSAGLVNQRALLKDGKWSTLEVNAGE
jgi:hypothetical protein